MIIKQLKYFIVEDVRSARRFLKKVSKEINIDDLTFSILNEQTPLTEIPSLIAPLLQGNNVGILSEAGCPAVADPGAAVVQLAHKKKIRVVPLVGPSSILLSLMASGFNGQQFAFAGYLPVKQNDRVNALKHLEKKVYTENQTQIFIETPYRNEKLMEELIRTCSPQTYLCIAADITLPTEFIRTMPLAAWKNNLPDLNKRPAIFLLGTTTF